MQLDVAAMKMYYRSSTWKEKTDVSTGKYSIGPECVAYFHEKRRKEERQQYQQALKLKDEYDNLLAEVKAIRALNKAPKQWSVGQLRSMVKWYKRDELYKAMPGKK